MESKWKGLRLDYSYNIKTKTVDYHWNRQGFSARFPIKNHAPAGRTGAILYEGARAFLYAGTVLVVFGAITDVESIVVASNPLRRSTQVLTAWALAWAGARGAGAIGTEIGTMVQPGAGTAVGGIVFALGGGVAGYWAGEKGGSEVYEWAATTLFSALPRDERAGRHGRYSAAMSTFSGGTLTVDIQRVWDASLMQTSALQPSGSHALLLGWTVDRACDDGGMPPVVAAGISRGLAAYGLVAGRWFDEPSLADDLRFMPAPSRGIGGRLIDRLTHGWPADLIATRSPQIVCQLFKQGWWMQYQAILVLDPLDEADTDGVFEALRTRRDWNAFDFPRPALALIAPGVDGDFALLAAASEARLSSLLDALRSSLLASGISLSAAGPV